MCQVTDQELIVELCKENIELRRKLEESNRAISYFAEKVAQCDTSE